MAHERRLRVGVVCAGTSLPAWEVRCIGALLGVPRAEVVLVVRDEPGGPDPTACGAIWRLYARHVVAARSRAMRPVEVLDRLGPIPIVRGEEAAAVRAARVDVVLWLAGDPRPLESLDVPRHGVWTFCYGDGEAYRAGPPGFWEIHDAEPVTGAALVRLTDGGARGVIIPETYLVREVSLFRGEARLTRWVKVRTLVENFAALDPTVFQHGGRWWLFCSDGDAWPEAMLHAWHARDLLGPWRPHLANPLKVGIRGSRPAGTPFVHEGRLYRPAQDLSRTYGGAVTLNRVCRLTPEDFEEEPVAVVRPDPAGPYPDGLHTLCAVGDQTLVGGKRLVLVWPRRRVFSRARRPVRAVERK